jgi:AraC-like DNA-binding protein
MLQSSGPFQVYRPRPPLGEFVDYFWIYEGYVPPHPRERLLPTATTELVFSLDAKGLASSGVSGARTQPLVLDTSTAFSVIAVHFRPGGGFPFFGVPSPDLRNQGVTLDLLWGRLATTVRDRLWEETAAASRFKVLEETLLTRARGRLDRHAAMRYALDVFERSNGMRPVADVIQRIGLSARRFGDVFLSEVGVSPKTFCRIRRFNEVLKRIEHDTSVDWSDVALSCGYFDQAHFNHDFRACAGVTPSAYLRDRMSRTHVVVSNT